MGSLLRQIILPKNPNKTTAAKKSFLNHLKLDTYQISRKSLSSQLSDQSRSEWASQSFVHLGFDNFQEWKLQGIFQCLIIPIENIFWLNWLINFPLTCFSLCFRKIHIMIIKSLDNEFFSGNISFSWRIIASITFHDLDYSKRKWSTTQFIRNWDLNKKYSKIIKNINECSCYQWGLIRFWGLTFSLY